MDVRDFKPIPCFLHYGLTNYFADLALNLECFFTIIRFVSVVYPHRASIIFNNTKTSIIILLIAFLLIPKNFFVTSVVKCANKSLLVYGVYLNFAVKTGVPAPINIFCTIRIIFALIQADKRRKNLIHAPTSNEKLTQESSSKTRSLTTMLFLINISFVLTYIPYFIFKFIPEQYFYNKKYEEQVARYVLFDQLFDILYHLHHSFFCIYLTMGSLFRKALCSCFHSQLTSATTRSHHTF